MIIGKSKDYPRTKKGRYKKIKKTDLPDEIVEIKCPQCGMPVRMARELLYRGNRIRGGFIYRKKQCVCNASIKLEVIIEPENPS